MERKLRLSPGGTLRFVILFGLTLFLWGFFRSYLLLMALVLLVCCPVVSFVLLWISRDGLGARAVLPDRRIGTNVKAAMDIRVSNPRRFTAFTADITYSHSNLFTGYTAREKRHIWVAPAGGSAICHDLISQYAGRVEAKIENVEFYDLFHIFCLQGCDRTDAHVIVWPDFSEAEEQELNSCVENFPGENESRRRGTDYNPDYEIREYIPGDELKSIHWKLSAKQGRMMVRERRAAGREKMNVLLPLGEDRAQNDLLMKSVYALCRLLLEKEYPVQLYWPGHGEQLREFFMAEQGELENVLCEILSDSGLHPSGTAEDQMAAEHPGVSYIMVQTGAYKGAYIR